MRNTLTFNEFTAHRTNDPIHLIRHRINILLTHASNYPVISVRARTGFGKTRAVCDFLRWQNHPFLFLQFTSLDNSTESFWENITASVMHIDTQLAEKCRKIGFPDTQEKVRHFLRYIGHTTGFKPFAIICDDFHNLKNKQVLVFMEKIINNLPPNIGVILIHHEMPDIDIKKLRENNSISEVGESDLNFTEIELANCLKQQNVNADSQTVRDILKDTGGWALAVNLAVHSLKKFPRYTGFVRSRLKPNIFEFIESEHWIEISENLKHFLIQLSLIDRLDAELVNLLADSTGCNEELLFEFRQQIAYIKFDNPEGIYFIHPLYLDFLREKQSILGYDEKSEFYKIAINRHEKNPAILSAV